MDAATIAFFSVAAAVIVALVVVPPDAETGLIRTMFDVLLYVAATFGMPLILLGLAVAADYDRTVLIGILVSVAIVWFAFVGPRLAGRVDRLLVVLEIAWRPSRQTLRWAARVLALVAVVGAGFLIPPLPDWIAYTVNGLLLSVQTVLVRMVAQKFRRESKKHYGADDDEAYGAFLDYAVMQACFGIGIASLALVASLLLLGPFGTEPGALRTVLAALVFPVSLVGLRIAARYSEKMRRLDRSDRSTFAPENA
jgi:hypothetical protein